MATVGQTTDTVIDITRRFEWEFSTEQFEGCPVKNLIHSPAFTVKTDSEVSHWRLAIGKYKTKNDVMLLTLLPGGVTVKVEVEGMGIKTETGLRPGKPITVLNEFKLKMISKIEQFSGRDNVHERSCGISLGLTEDFLKLFSKNKMTVVATLRFYMDRNDYIEKNERVKNFLTHLQTIPDLDTLADFTIICGDREFKCHRVVLASRSTVFKAMMLNDRFMENGENSITIEKSSPDIVDAMLEFISKGVVPDDLEEKAIDLIDLADRYDLQDLIEICESSLINNLAAESVIETLIAIDLHVPNSQRRQKILDFIKTKAVEVVKSSHWREFLVKYLDLVAEIFLWAALPPGEPSEN